jgi:transposase
MLIVTPNASTTNPLERFVTPPWDADHPRFRDIDQQLDPHHPAYLIAAAVDRLDLCELFASYGNSGSQPHRPDLMLKAVLYQMRLGQHQPTQWLRAAQENDPMRWLLQGDIPGRTCWYDFRQRVGPLLDHFHQQILQQAQAEHLTPATRAALDGTTVAANASRHKMINATKLQQRCAQLAQAIAADVQGQAVADRPRWMAKTPTGRRRQQRRLAQAQQRMEALHSRNQDRRSSKRKAAEKIVVSTSDPASMPGRDKEKVYRPLYNVQLADDVDSPFVLGYEVFAQQNDNGTLAPMIQQLHQHLGHPIAAILADSTYASGADLAVADAQGVVLYAPVPGEDTPKKGKKKAKAVEFLAKQAFVWQASEGVYICPQGHRLEYAQTTRQKRLESAPVVMDQYRCAAEHCQACPLQKGCTPNPHKGRSISRSEHEDLVDALRQRMETPQGKELYRLRSQSVELVNADMKEHRKLRRFSARGVQGVRCQIGLLVLAHNLVTLMKELQRVRNREEKAGKAAAISPGKIAS